MNRLEKIGHEKNQIRSNIDKDLKKINICIKDCGSGISASEKEAVFRRFYRGDASRSTEGNGLGLSLVKAIIDLHQGSILLEDNNPGLCARVIMKSYQ